MDCSINNLWKPVKSHQILMIGKGLWSEASRPASAHIVTITGLSDFKNVSQNLSMQDKIFMQS